MNAKPATDTDTERVQASAQGSTEGQRIVLVPSNIWRIGMVGIGVVAVAGFLWFIIDDGGAVLFTVLMAWFASLAMEPAVSRLAKHMRRGLATGLTMLAVVLFIVVFLLMFGQLLVEQLAQLVRAIPGLTDSAIAWVNERFQMNLELQDILESVNLSEEETVNLAAQVGGNVLGVLGTVLGSVFSLFTLGLFTFYLSADGKRLRTWIARLFPQRVQPIVINVWDLTAEKTGGYVAARVVLAVINGGTSAIVFFIIGMPYALALGIWTGLVSQFVPTIGTYIAIVLPVIVGLLSPNPWIGVIALIWAVLYQQVENLTFEPKISANAVDVNPAVSFGAVMLGAALFGVAGAVLAVPVIAMLLALLGVYVQRNELLPSLRDEDPDAIETTDPQVGPEEATSTRPGQ